ncbi:MAG: hypothetical protein ABH846_03525 [Patescibacteria group bacterium]
MKISSIITVIIALIIIGLSAFLIFSREPEETMVQSSDGIVEITGLARESQPITIETLDPIEGDRLFGPLYKIEPSTIVLENPVTIFFDIAAQENQDDLVVYQFDESAKMWEQVEPIVSFEDDLIIAANQLGTFAVGKYFTIDAPNFLTLYDELLTMAPEKAVGFELVTGFATADEPLVKISKTEQTGGCGGLLQSGNREEKSLIQHEARVLVDDVETFVEFSFVARWFVNDVEGCSEGEDLEPFSVM